VLGFASFFRLSWGAVLSVSQRTPARNAFDDAVVLLEKSARAYLRRYRLPPEDADDILQQTLLVYLYKHQEIYNPEAWIRGTLRKRCLLFWRRRRKSLLRTVDASLLEGLSAPAVDESGAGGDMNRHLGRALQTIPVRCRTLLKLRYEQDCNPQDAAAQLGYRPSGAYKIFERCLAALTRGLVATGFLKEKACEES
jgi:RNA polymerase sigma factor (sigma-70 family)